MVQFTYPGIYISEKAGGPGPIVGASTSTLALIGFTPEGVTDEPTLSTSFLQFERQFGTFTSQGLTPTSAFNFFSNGGARLVTVRVVADDAGIGSCSLTEAVTGEVSVESPTADGVVTFFVFTGSAGLDNLPIVVSSLTITGTASTNGEVFTDDGDGTLTGAGGGSGTIDYNTGEFTLTFNAAPSADLAITSAYSYKTHEFTMKWAGVAGNEFRIQVFGDTGFEDQSTASFSRFVVETQRSSDGGSTFSTIEAFGGVVLDDASSSSFIENVLNDETLGSNYVTVVTFNASNPTALVGAVVASEALAELPVYDGSEKAFTYAIANAVSQSSFVATITLAENALSVGAGVVGTAQTAQLALGAIADTATLSIDFDGATETFTLTTPGDASGILTGDAGGSGTVVFATGVVALTLNGAASGGEAIIAEFNYLPHVISDDGNSGVLITSTTGPDNWILDVNGTNSLTYGDATVPTVGSLALTWRNTQNPAAGPSDSTVVVIQVADYFQQAAANLLNCPFTGGTDGSAVTRSNISAATLVADRKGLFALEKTDELLQIVIPDFEADPIVSGDLIDYCETRKDRFGIIAVPEGLDVNGAVNYKKNTLNKLTNRAAIYYPHITILDPVTEKALNVPPGGHIAGIYARTDDNRNVSKAPAGTVDGVIRAAISLEKTLSLDEVGELNTNSINSLVQFDFTGRVVWGARTVEGFAGSGEFPYIQMRRLFMFVEKSVFNSTQVHVFESNTVSLRARIKLQVESFLTTLFNTAHFSGQTPADAYFVNDITTTDDVKKGIVSFDIGMAPTRPAEFISFIFSQKVLENA